MKRSAGREQAREESVVEPRDWEQPRLLVTQQRARVQAGCALF